MMLTWNHSLLVYLKTSGILICCHEFWMLTTYIVFQFHILIEGTLFVLICRWTWIIALHCHETLFWPLGRILLELAGSLVILFPFALQTWVWIVWYFICVRLFISGDYDFYVMKWNSGFYRYKIVLGCMMIRCCPVCGCAH